MRPSITWLITDTHWNHEQMFVLCNRPPDFNKRILSNLKQFCMPQDTLIHLGDIIFKDYSNLQHYLNYAPCTKILIRGNHDKETDNWYVRKGFSFVCETFSNKGILFSHKPQEVIPKDIKYNIHGHWHNTVTMIRPEKPTLEQLMHDRYPPPWYLEKHILLCLEDNNYRPWNLQSLLDSKNQKIKNVEIKNDQEAI